MFPIRDSIPSRNFPILTIALIVMNALIFFYEFYLGDRLGDFIRRYGLIPDNFFFYTETHQGGLVERYGPFFTSMFLHGGWMHVISNMWYLWIFGDNIEDRLGRGRFFIFYILCGLAAGVAHLLLNADSKIPTVGASGAIAGIMGAYVVLYPRARVQTLIPIFIFIQFIEIPAFFFLGFWVLLQFFQGTASLMSADSGGVAWWAHLGGFVFGAVFVKLFVRQEEYDVRADQ